MLDVVFSDSAKACIHSELSKGTFEDVVSIGFYLDIGPIATIQQCVNREDIFQQLWGRFNFSEDDKHEFLMDCIKDQQKLLEVANRKEPIRIWTSNAPYECCGLYYVCYLLKDIDCDIRLMQLPEYIDHTTSIQSYTSWQEVPIDCLTTMTKYEIPLTSSLKQFYYASTWHTLMVQNAPLRIVLNGTLVSVADDFYDPFIRQCIPEGKFTMAFLICIVIGTIIPGVHDSFIAFRIQHMIDTKELLLIEEGLDNSPYGHTLCRG